MAQTRASVRGPRCEELCPLAWFRGGIRNPVRNPRPQNAVCYPESGAKKVEPGFQGLKNERAKSGHL